MKNVLLAGLFAISGMAFATSVAAHPGHSHGTPSVETYQSRTPADPAKAHASATLDVSGCWIRSLPAPAPSAGYFVVKNKGDQARTLKSASSAAYGMVMLHQTTHKDGMSRMSETHDIAIPPGAELEFKPGSYHAMLEKPVSTPKVGSKIAMDFVFDNGEKATAQCEVREAKAMAPMSH